MVVVILTAYVRSAENRPGIYILLVWLLTSCRKQGRCLIILTAYIQKKQRRYSYYSEDIYLIILTALTENKEDYLFILYQLALPCGWFTKSYLYLCSSADLRLERLCVGRCCRPWTCLLQLRRFHFAQGEYVGFFYTGGGCCTTTQILRTCEISIFCLIWIWTSSE